MTGSDQRDKMVGRAVDDPHKNTNRCKKVNDRLRRRAKRLGRKAWKADIAR